MSEHLTAAQFVAQARADAEQCVRAADTEQDKASLAAATAEDTARHAGQETVRAQAAAALPRPKPSGRVIFITTHLDRTEMRGGGGHLAAPGTD